jgi:hypothetical protein
MASLYSASMEVLSQIVGPVPAELCLLAGSAELGKEREALTEDDFDAIVAKIRAELMPFASPDLIDLAVEEIRMRLDGGGHSCGCKGHCKAEVGHHASATTHQPDARG